MPLRRISRGRLRSGLGLAGAAALGAALQLLAPPAGRAIETIRLRLPMLQSDFIVKVSELRDPEALLRGNSDLAELNRATDGAIGVQLGKLLNSALPIEARAVVRNARGSALLDQVLLLVAALGEVEGMPQNQPESAQLEQALNTAAAKGNVTLADVLAVVPGDTAKVDLNRFLVALQRLKNQQQEAQPLLASVPAATTSDTLAAPGGATPLQRQLSIAVQHRPEPLELVVVEPNGDANGRLVMISHGLWDAPESFIGWANHLASHGYTVVMPRHPGSDNSQQQAMLAGKAPPPKPVELKLRPLDVSAAIDAAGEGRLGLRNRVDADNVLVAGHSWGATTVLQLAGVQPSSVELKAFCNDVKDPARNLSWVLQCSFLEAADRSGMADPRVKTAVAVSPPMRLLFATGANQGMNANVLVVSGSRDWVVPVGPEAIEPLRNLARDGGIGGNRLVLAEGGDHFNLRAHGDQPAPLNALLLAWFQGQGQLPANGWGDARLPLRDVTTRVSPSPADSSR